jgi:hypothetical protein
MRRALVVAALLAAVSGPATAHHNFRALFDVNCTVTFGGVVTKVEWLNPHVWIYVRKPVAGKPEQWGFELGPPNALVRRGWRGASLKAGDQVTVTGYCARNGSKTAALSKIVLPNGRELFGAQKSD